MAAKISQLQEYWQVILRRLWVIISFTALVVGGTAVVTFKTVPVYEARTLVLIEKQAKNEVRSARVEAETVQDDYYLTQYEIIKSWSLMQIVVKEMGLDKNPEFAGPEPAGILQSRVRVLPVPRSRLVQIAVQSGDPVLAASIANTVARNYIAQNLENRVFLSREALKVMEVTSSSASIESLPAVVGNPLIQELKVQLAKLQGEWANLSKRYRPRYPRMVQLSALIENTQSQIEQESRRIAESVKLQLGGQYETNNVRVIDEARVPRWPIKPRKRLNLCLALIFGLTASFGLAIFIDDMDPTIHGQEDFERVTQLPFLGVVYRLAGLPKASARCFAALWSRHQSPELEAFWRLHTAVSFRVPLVNRSSVVLVASSIPQEGKSLVSANLARTFAEAGEKVLLIDGDMRNPSLQRVFGVANDRGLSNYLVRQTHPQELLHKTGILNLDFLPSGACPENPIEFLGEAKLKPLLAWAATRYNRIIIDSAPILPVADSLLWIKFAHGVLFVILSDRTKATLIQQALAALREHSAKMIGGVMNCPSWHSEAGYYYGYGSGQKTIKPLPPGSKPQGR